MSGKVQAGYAGRSTVNLLFYVALILIYLAYSNNSSHRLKTSQILPKMDAKLDITRQRRAHTVNFDQCRVLGTLKLAKEIHLVFLCIYLVATPRN